MCLLQIASQFCVEASKNVLGVSLVRTSFPQWPDATFATLGRGTVVVRASVTESDLRRGVAAAWTGIIALGLGLLVLGWLIARQLGRRISEPLREVAVTAHQLREGDLTARADVRGTPETVELARALNGLAERNKDIARVSSIGKSLEGRDILAININSNPAALASGESTLPGRAVSPVPGQRFK